MPFGDLPQRAGPRPRTAATPTQQATANKASFVAL
jgi:hypothetical protein